MKANFLSNCPLYFAGILLFRISFAVGFLFNQVMRGTEVLLQVMLEIYIFGLLEFF